MDGDDYTYDKHLPPQTGTQILHEEITDLRGQVAQLADANMQLAQRVEVLEAVQRPRAATVVSVYDWED